MRITLTTLLLFLSASLNAETLSWEPPTQRVDGTPLDPLTEIKEYRLTCGDVVTLIEPVTDSGNTHQFSKHDVLSDYGSTECSMAAVDNNGLESEPSNSITINWKRSPPREPTNLIIISED